MRTHAFRAAFLFAYADLLAANLRAQDDQPFRKYVALGNSITAGIQGNCLVERHQRNTYPAIIARQLGITDFQLPLVGETRTVTNPSRVCLGAVVAGGTITVGAVSQMTNPLNPLLPRPYDNLGFSGARVADLVDLRNPNPAGNNVNMSAALVLRNVPESPFAGSNAVEQANMLTPDLVTLWIGNNDVLGAMLAGVAADGVTLTPRAAFSSKYNEVVTGLLETQPTALVVLNIPDVGALPFATTVPPVVVNPTTRQPILIGGNPVPLLGSRAVGACTTPPCPIPSDTLVTLQAIPLLSQGIGIPVALGGTGQPLPDGSFVPPATLNAGVLLYADEVAAIRARTNELNGEIAAAASSNGAILVDTHAVFDEILAEGLHFGGIELGAEFLTGGLFSADGVHPNNIGHAIIADEIIQALNEEHDLEIPRPNIGEVLFAPDVPPTVATRVDPWEAWKSLLGAYPPAEGIDVQLPVLQGKRPPTKGKGRLNP